MTSTVSHRPLLRFALVGLMVVAGSTWVSAPASAAAQVRATVSPSLLDLNAEAGADGDQQISVLIESDSEIVVTAAIVPYEASVDVQSAVDWLSLDETEQSAGSDGEAVFDLMIDIPDDAESGGHYAAVTLTTGAAASEDEVGPGQAAVQGRFIVPVLFTIGEEAELVRSAEFGRLAPVLEQDGRIGIWGELTNTGNVAVRAPGELTIDDADGEPVAELEFPATTPILPGETEIIRATGTLPLPEGTEYSAAATIDVGGEDPVEAEASFGVVPTEPEGDLAICENLDRGPTVDVMLRNPGDLGLSATVGLAINDADGNQVAATTLPDALLIWPASEQMVGTDAPTRLETGRYVLVASIQAGAGEPTTIELPFEIGGASPETAPLCPPLAD